MNAHWDTRCIPVGHAAWCAFHSRASSFKGLGPVTPFRPLFGTVSVRMAPVGSLLLASSHLHALSVSLQSHRVLCHAHMLVMSLLVT